MATATQTLKPPVTSVGVLGWLRKNLFNTWYNSLLTVVALWLVYTLGTALWNAIASSDFSVIAVNLRLFMIGRYPLEQAWRVQAAVSLLAFLLGASWASWRGIMRSMTIAVGALFLTLALLPFELNARLWLAANIGLIALGFGLGLVARARRLLSGAWVLAPFVVFLLLYGVGDRLPTISTDLWGGLLLTFMLAIVSIVASFPLGVLLAVGRQSSYPTVRLFCILYIEVVRGVPLITVLFMVGTMLPLFLSEGTTVERAVRAMIGFTLFTAAYLAETVRGGLQSIGRGQSEAARALGLNPLQSLWLIVLPQALRNVIPAIVGQFISLFKDTSLAAIIGLLELAGVAQAVTQQQAFLNRRPETYIFIALIYFVCAFSMSYASRRLERALGVGER